MELKEVDINKAIEGVLKRINDRYLEINPGSQIDDDTQYYLTDPDMDSEVLGNYDREDLLNHSYDLGQYYLLQWILKQGNLPY